MNGLFVLSKDWLSKTESQTYLPYLIFPISNTYILYFSIPHEMSHEMQGVKRRKHFKTALYITIYL
jgi:hypothetical protein